MKLVLLSLLSCAAAKQWPYDRFESEQKDTGHLHANLTLPEFESSPDDLFVDWLRNTVNNDQGGELQRAFINQSIPAHISTIEELIDTIAAPVYARHVVAKPLAKSNETFSAPKDVKTLFQHLQYPLDPKCITNSTRWWYRTQDGSCNWLKDSEADLGQIGTAKPRDYDQHFYADGVSKPRDGPNPRAVSNAFFKRKTTPQFLHTPLLLGLVEVYNYSNRPDYITDSLPVFSP